MLLLDKLAEQRIREAEARGDFEDLPGAGEPLRLEQENPYIPAELRTAYRLLKNAGYIPEEVGLLRNIQEAEQLLLLAETVEQKQEASTRLRLLLSKMSEHRSLSLATQQEYFDRLSQRLSSSC